MSSIRDDIFSAMMTHSTAIPGAKGIKKILGTEKKKPKKRRKKVRKGGVTLRRSETKGIWVDEKGRKYKKSKMNPDYMVREDGVWFEYDKKTDKWYPQGS